VEPHGVQDEPNDDGILQSPWDGEEEAGKATLDYDEVVAGEAFRGEEEVGGLHGMEVVEEEQDDHLRTVHEVLDLGQISCHESHEDHGRQNDHVERSQFAFYPNDAANVLGKLDRVLIPQLQK
jgi:hypothetical protein